MQTFWFSAPPTHSHCLQDAIQGADYVRYYLCLAEPGSHATSTPPPFPSTL